MAFGVHRVARSIVRGCVVDSKLAFAGDGVMLCGRSLLYLSACGLPQL